MTPPKLLVLLLPSHGMEDLPESPEEEEAEELLAAFACLAHPAAAATVNRPPCWERADMPPPLHEGDVVLVPSSCDTWMEPTWTPEVEAQGVRVIRGHQTLEQWFDAVGEAYGEPPVAAEVREAFAAVGLMRLFVERLARRLHNFDGVDEHRVFDGLRNAWKAIRQNDGEVVSAEELRRLLMPCYDELLEYRERVHPLEPTVLDVVMLGEECADHVQGIMNGLSGESANAADLPLGDVTAVNLMADVDTWTAILKQRPELAESIRALWPQRKIDLLLGENESCETRLEPLEITAERLQNVRKWSLEHFGRVPRVWARREFGLHPDMPALLKSAGYTGAVHLTFDVGNYPETEDAKLTWQSLDRTGIEAFSRLPLPASRASTFWQFPDRLAESIELDAVAAIMLVRWSESEPWWLRCLRLACESGPVVGRMKAIGDFFAEADGHSSVLRGDAKEYFSAALAKRVALKSTDPLYQEVQRWSAYRQKVTDRVCGGLASLLSGKPVGDSPAVDLANAISGSSDATGTMVLNPLPIERTAIVNATGGLAHVTVPPYGYAWVSDDAKPFQGRPLVEELTLQNEHFQIEISQSTGGVKRLMKYGRRGNFLSQHVARRMSDGADDEYLTCRASEVSVLENTPVRASIRSRGQIVDSENKTLANVEQVFTVVRGQPWFDIGVTVDAPEFDDGNPWLTYDAVRFAWSTEFSTVSQSCGLSPTGAAADRMESPLFIEIDDELVVTLLTHGRTFHRRSGRTLDTLLAVAGEKRRTARFSVGVGVRNPAALALAAMTTPTEFIRRTARPKVDTAWLAWLDKQGVAILGIWPETNDDGERRLVVRLQETNGAASTVTLQLCRRAAEALARDLAGRLTDRLLIRDGAIEIRMREHQMREIVVKLA